MGDERSRHLAQAHLVSSGKLRSVQTFNEKMLKENLKVLVPGTVWLMAEGVNCLQVDPSLVDDAFIDRASKLRHRTFVLAGTGKRL